jgi:hypothetical protein
MSKVDEILNSHITLENSKNTLQTLCLYLNYDYPKYYTEKENGKDHNPTWKATLTITDKNNLDILFKIEAIGSTTRQCEKIAALECINKLRQQHKIFAHTDTRSSVQGNSRSNSHSDSNRDSNRDIRSNSQSVVNGERYASLVTPPKYLYYPAPDEVFEK